MARLVHVADAGTRAAARTLIREYLEWIAAVAREQYGLMFDIDAMVDSDVDDPHKFYPPSGRFYVVEHEGAYVGVGCLKRLSEGAGEIQRMYVRPSVRGIGAGRMIVERLIADARELGFSTLRLESLKALAPAHALYRSVGFVEIDPYAENSMKKFQPSDTLDVYRASALFMELAL